MNYIIRKYPKSTRFFTLLSSVILLSILFSSCGTADAPNNVAKLLDLGEKFLFEQNYEQALVQFLKVIETEPMNPRGYTGAAEAYVGLERISDAIAVLEKGIAVIGPEAGIQGMLDRLQETGHVEAEQETDAISELDETPEPESLFEQAPASEPAEVSMSQPITITGYIDDISVLFAEKFNEYREQYENEETILAGSTCILFDTPIEIIVDDESITMSGAILATSDVIEFIGKEVSITGYFSKQNYLFQQEITGPHSVAELMDNPDESGYVYYYNPVGCYLLVPIEIMEKL